MPHIRLCSTDFSLGFLWANIHGWNPSEIMQDEETVDDGRDSAWAIVEARERTVLQPRPIPFILSLPSLLIWFYLRKVLGVQIWGYSWSFRDCTCERDFGLRFLSNATTTCFISMHNRPWFWPKLLAEVVCTGLLEDHVTKVRIKTLIVGTCYTFILWSH
jgi:hypothetical protein